MKILVGRRGFGINDRNTNSIKVFYMRKYIMRGLVGRGGDYIKSLDIQGGLFWKKWWGKRADLYLLLRGEGVVWKNWIFMGMWGFYWKMGGFRGKRGASMRNGGLQGMYGGKGGFWWICPNWGWFLGKIKRFPGKMRKKECWMSGAAARTGKLIKKVDKK